MSKKQTETVKKIATAPSVKDGVSKAYQAAGHGGAKKSAPVAAPKRGRK